MASHLTVVHGTLQRIAMPLGMRIQNRACRIFFSVVACDEFDEFDEEVVPGAQVGPRVVIAVTNATTCCPLTFVFVLRADFRQN